jgi:hypothetical protein
MRIEHIALPLKAAAAVLAAGLLLLAGCASAPKPPEEAALPEAGQPLSAPEPEAMAGHEPAETPRGADLAEKWGVQIVGLRRTSGGYMLDFRFRVLDARKAAPLFVRQTKPYLIDVRTGARFQVPSPPKTGPLRTSNPPQEGRVYWMFFANPGQYLKAGSPATVVIGDFQAQNLIVE